MTSDEYCPDCQAVGAWHCADPENCGGMRPKPPAMKNLPPLRPQAEIALDRIGYIIADAPYRGEERDGAWQAFLENKKIVLESLLRVSGRREEEHSENCAAHPRWKAGPCNCLPAAPDAAAHDEIKAELARHADGLIGYVVDNGSLHDDDCPGDDTCECSEKPKNDAANAICRLAEAIKKQQVGRAPDAAEEK